MRWSLAGCKVHYVVWQSFVGCRDLTMGHTNPNNDTVGATSDNDTSNNIRLSDNGNVNTEEGK